MNLYSKTIFEKDETVRDAFVNVFTGRAFTHAMGHPWVTRVGADKAMTNRATLYRINVKVKRNEHPAK